MARSVRPRIYLTGGFSTGWQDQVIRRLARYYEVYSMHDHPGGLSGAAFSASVALDESEVVFGYLSKDEPDCHICFAELASVDSRWRTILVDEWRDKRSFWLARFAGVTRVYHSLDEAIDHLLLNVADYQQQRKSNESMIKSWSPDRKRQRKQRVERLKELGSDLEDGALSE